MRIGELLHHYLPCCTIAHADDVDALLRLGYNSALNIVSDNLRQFFRCHHISDSIFVREGIDCTKAVPRCCRPVSLKRTSWHMKGCIFSIRTIECIIDRFRNLLCQAIDIFQAAAANKGKVTNACHAVADDGGCQAGAVSPIMMTLSPRIKVCKFVQLKNDGYPINFILPLPALGKRVLFSCCPCPPWANVFLFQIALARRGQIVFIN